MNVNGRLLNEAKTLEKRWSPTEYLKDVKGSYKRMAVSVLLENQRLMNEISKGVDNDYKRKLIQLVAYVYPRILAWDIVGVQPLLGPAGLIYYLSRRLSDENIAVESEDICARTRSLKRRITDDFGPKDVGYDIVNEINQEILTDLWNNCGFVGAINLQAYTEKASKVINDFINDEYLTRAMKYNWLAVNHSTYRKYAFDKMQFSRELRIHVSEGVKGVLFGYKGESYMDVGYVYSPYVPFTQTPVVLDPFTFQPSERVGLLTRYGKKLLKLGSSYYARLGIIENEQKA